MLLRSDPFRELDRFTERVFGPRVPAMPMDAYRQGDRYVVHLDVPGIDPESIDVAVDQNVLTVAGERRWNTDAIEIVANERVQGRFRREIYLGESLDTDHVEASYDRGVLTITIPVAEGAKVRRIAIGSGSANAQAIEANATVA
jgi:HSP20 family protein